MVKTRFVLFCSPLLGAACAPTCDIPPAQLLCEGTLTVSGGPASFFRLSEDGCASVEEKEDADGLVVVSGDAEIDLQLNDWEPTRIEPLAAVPSGGSFSIGDLRLSVSAAVGVPFLVEFSEPNARDDSLLSMIVTQTGDDQLTLEEVRIGTDPCVTVGATICRDEVTLPASEEDNTTYAVWASDGDCRIEPGADADADFLVSANADVLIPDGSPISIVGVHVPQWYFLGDGRRLLFSRGMRAHAEMLDSRDGQRFTMALTVSETDITVHRVYETISPASP